MATRAAVPSHDPLFSLVIASILGYTCTFDDYTKCGIWEDAADDVFDWILQSGPTDSDDTGPQTGHGSGIRLALS